MPAVVAPADRRFRRAHVKPARRKVVARWQPSARCGCVGAVVVVGGGGFYAVQHGGSHERAAGRDDPGERAIGTSRKAR